MESQSRLPVSRDTATGLLYILIGGATAVGSLSYRLGTATRPGPGSFPFALGLLLAVLGLIVLIGDLRKRPELRQRIEEMHWRAPLFLVIAVSAFGLLISRFGVVAAVAALTLLGALASRQSRWGGTLICTLSFCIVSIVLFVWALGVHLPIAPFLIGR